MPIVFLEDFAARHHPAAPEPPRPEDQPGYVDGFDAGRAAAIREQAQLSAELVQTLGELTFGLAEAHRQVIAQLEPLFTALAEAVLPEILQDSFGLHLAEVLTRAANADATAPAILRLHPDQAAVAGPIVHRHAALPIRIVPDPDIGPGEARLSGADGGTVLDLDALREALAETLAALIPQDTEARKHG